jgi:deoxyxylulose-5-phosphate synthase
LKDAIEKVTLCNSHPTVIRFPKAGFVVDINKSTLIESKLLILAVGSMAERAHEALGERRAMIVNIRRVQPFDFNKLHEIMKTYGSILLLEEGINGGFSSSLLHFLSNVHDEQTFKKLHIMTLPKEPIIHDSVERQLEHCRISVHDISAVIEELLRLDDQQSI